MSLEQTACEDLKAFERRLTEVIACLQPSTTRWRIVLIIVSVCVAAGAGQWLTDPYTRIIPLSQSLSNHPFFIIATVLLVIIFLLGVHKRVIAASIITTRTREVLCDFNMSCDDTADYINVCSQDDKDLAACIINSIMLLMPRLRTGIPEINVPAIEPLLLETLHVLDHTSLATNFTNVLVWGISDLKFVRLIPTIEKDTREFAFEVHIPNLHVKGDYEINTNWTLIRLRGEGPFNANISNVQIECDLKGKKVQTNEENYLKFHEVTCTAIIGKFSIYLENVFNGDPAVVKGVNDAIEDNSEALIEEITPNIVEAVAAKLLQVGNGISGSFTFEELFP